MAKGKLPTDGGGALGQNPFGDLDAGGLPSGLPATGGAALISPSAAPPGRRPAPRNRGRVDVRRETGGRGGKTVTVVDGFTGIGLPEKEQLAKKLRAACGCGGTVKGDAIEIQGDQREAVARMLAAAGFRPVMAGG